MVPRVKPEDDGVSSFRTRCGIHIISTKGYIVKNPAVYLLASQKNGTLYIGVTSDLVKRIHEHKTHCIDGFTSQYYVDRLVWYEIHNDMTSAITREKAIKKWKREWKIALISQNNPQWEDLYESICF